MEQFAFQVGQWAVWRGAVGTLLTVSWAAALASLSGVFLLALNNDISWMGWLPCTLGSVLWMGWAYCGKNWALVTTQIGGLSLNIYGIWNWVL